MVSSLVRLFIAPRKRNPRTLPRIARHPRLMPQGRPGHILMSTIAAASFLFIPINDQHYELSLAAWDHNITMPRHFGLSTRQLAEKNMGQPC